MSSIQLIANLSGSLVTDAINGVELKNVYYWINLIAESSLSGLISYGAYAFAREINIINVPGFKDIFAGLSVLAEFIFNFLYGASKSLIKEIVEFL